MEKNWNNIIKGMAIAYLSYGNSIVDLLWITYVVYGRTCNSSI